MQTSSGKNFVRDKAVSFLQKKIGTEVKIGELNYSIPNWIQLNDVLFIDQQKDTLFSGKSLLVNLDMFKLISGNVSLNEIHLKNIKANINRKPNDSSFNFQYIVNAFASKTLDTSTAKKATNLKIDKIILDTVSVSFNDKLNQLFCNAFVGKLNSRISSIDLDKMGFDVTDFFVKNTTIILVDKSTKKEKAVVAAVPDKGLPFNLLVRNFDVQKLKISYANISSKLDYYNLVDTLQLRDANLHLLQEVFTAKAVSLSNSAFAIITNDPYTNVKDTVANVIQLATKQGWNIKIDTIHFNKNNVALDNNAFAKTKEGFDYNHLQLNSISLQTNSVHYNIDTINASIKSGSVLANNFLVKNIKGDVVYDDKKASLKGFLLATQNSLFGGDGEVAFNKTKANELLNEKSKISFNINKSYLGYNDLLFFIPSYKRKSPIDLKPTQKILFNGKADGTLQDLDIAMLDAKTDDGKLQLNANGKAKNVLNTKTLRYNVVVNKLYVDKTILSANMRQQLQKQKFNLPANMLVNGTISGGIKDVNAKVKLTSPFGLASINAIVSNFTDVKNMHYNLDVTGNNLQTGKWIYQDSLLGLFTGNLKIKGNGTDYKKATIQTTTAVKSFVVKGYNYTNVNIDAAINKGAFTAKGKIDDVNLISNIDVAGTIGNQYPTIKGTIIIDKADLQKLNFTKDSIKVRSTIFVDAADLNPKNLNAILLLDSSIITYNGKRLYADSISIKANAANDSTKLFVTAPFAQANMIGKYDYEHLPTAVNAFIQHNYFKQNTDTLKVVNQQMVLNATINQDSILYKLLPNLVMEKTTTIYASFDNTKKDTSLVIAANIPTLFYNSIEAENINFKANGLDSTLNFNLSTNYIVASNKKFYNASAAGDFANNIAKVSVKTDDAYKKQFYAISSIIELLPDETKIHLSDSLLLNYDKWNVAKNNLIELKKDGYIITNFAINKNKQAILIANKEANTSSPIVFKIDNFNMGDVLAIANQDSTMAGGILNVDATIDQPIIGLPKVVGTAGIQQLTFKKVPIGDVALKTEINADQNITVKGGITGPNNLTIDGGYNTNDNTFSISTEIQQLNLKAVEAFSQGMITRTSGNVHGNVFANGTISDPRWKGELIFDTTQLSTAMFGSLYKINNQKIDFEYPNIGLYDFTVTDSLDNKLVLDGTIKSQTDKDFALNLNVNTKNFIAVNQPRSSTALIYGVGIVDAAMVIGGTSTTPDISGNLTLDNNSDIHYVLPAKNNYKDDLKEVVRFINIDTIKSFNNRNTIFTTASDTAIILKYTGLKYNLNLEVQDQANVTILIDPSTGDELNIKGKAQLNAGVDENGIIGLTGVYQLKEGSYNLSYQFIKRRFDLVEGSTITFSGNPLEAQADITAQYEVETSAKELLGNEITENSSALGTAYNKKIPFEVILKIKGPLTKPDLSFDIKVKDNADGVNTTLGTTIDNKLAQYRNDVSEMNKQVFALLILGRFIGDRSSDFFATNNSGGINTNDAVKQSVSKFLAEAVNQIAADLIKGVDINLDLKNYEGDAATNSANRTDLNVELSKQLLNDRLIVTVGKSFTIDGDDPLAKTQNNSNLQFLPDITTTYKLSKDGKYALKAYRKNQYEAILDGYFTETGVAFTLTMNYEKFKEIFQKGEKQAKKKNK
ncbi:MAG: translocation/assembly module TamB [Pedobacter sp.]|nr:translocation/assembly module TamB [Chitinophagaceae bacterium]